ncbi:MAG: hypothetical protein AAFV26_05975, partial [Pseudomonadota bacterium]
MKLHAHIRWPALFTTIGLSAFVALVFATTSARALDGIVPPKPQLAVRLAAASPRQQVEPWDLSESEMMFGVTEPRPPLDRAWKRSLPRNRSPDHEQQSAAPLPLRNPARPRLVARAEFMKSRAIVPWGTFNFDWFNAA